MKLHRAPVQLIAQNTLPYVADMHLDGAAVMIRADTREKAEELQALIVAATDAWLGRSPGLNCAGCGAAVYTGGDVCAVCHRKYVASHASFTGTGAG